MHGIRRRPWLVSLLAIWLLVPPVRPIHAQEEQEPPPPPEAPAPEASEAPAPPEAPEATATPPRLSYLHGDVSFWRPGAEDWAAARVNTPLAGGDSLYAPQGANIEVQAGPRAFVRAGGETDLGFDAVEPDFLQLKVTSGHAAIDLRNLERGHTVEVDTPHLAATIDQPGYYRVDVDQEATTFISRRGGSASVVPAGGEAVDLGANDEVIVKGADNPEVERYTAPNLDPWDRWNYERTDHLTNPKSARYVPQEVYGADDLDRYGRWRDEPEYGPVWVPTAVPAAWTPYSSGRWIWDPFYGWTWVDDLPWGWAPYHYGRWVSVGSVWGWAPGPIVVAPVYAPALVAFFGGSGVSVSIGIGAPVVSWVPLGWGEPCIPWWGPRAFIGVPWWGGWGGPHIVNNVVVERTTIIHANQVNIFRNTRVHNAIVGVRRDDFGRGGGKHVRLGPGALRRLTPVRGVPPVRPTPASLVPSRHHGRRPPEAVHARQVVATRPARDHAAPLRAVGLNAPAGATPAPRVVGSPRPRAAVEHGGPAGAGRAGGRPGPAPSPGRGRAERPAPGSGGGRTERPPPPIHGRAMRPGAAPQGAGRREMPSGEVRRPQPRAVPPSAPRERTERRVTQPPAPRAERPAAAPPVPRQERRATPPPVPREQRSYPRPAAPQSGGMRRAPGPAPGGPPAGMERGRQQHPPNYGQPSGGRRPRAVPHQGPAAPPPGARRQRGRSNV